VRQGITPRPPVCRAPAMPWAGQGPLAFTESKSDPSERQRDRVTVNGITAGPAKQGSWTAEGGRASARRDRSRGFHARNVSKRAVSSPRRPARPYSLVVGFAGSRVHLDNAMTRRDAMILVRPRRSVRQHADNGTGSRSPANDNGMRAPITPMEQVRILRLSFRRDVLKADLSKS
jgi:hypothetical protein